MCAQLEETLTGQLRRRQFLLATRDADRARLTRAGGYCPVHTWQYASLSPGSAGCALCQALANRERDAVTEAAAQAPDSPLCLQHLAMALTAGPRPQRDGP